nr:hypothetical protein [Comamonas testosteroni]
MVMRDLGPLFITILETDMWKLAIGFVVFAAISLFAIFKAGDSVDMSGEKHGADAVHAPAPVSTPSAQPK